MTDASPRARAFTLVELLIVIAIISVLTGVLVPSIGVARELAQSAAAQSNIRQLVRGQELYAARSDQWLAGPNTSGALGIATRGDAYIGSRAPSTPTSTHDWISPCLGDDLGLSANRAQRTWELFSRMACPRAMHRITRLWGASRDYADFDAANRKDAAVQISYLSPATFHYSPGKDAWTPRQLREANAAPMVGIPRPYQVPRTFRPKFDRIERPDARVLVADGTRYTFTLRGRDGVEMGLDFDVTTAPTIYGSFTSSGAIFHASRAYGRAYEGAVGEFNVDLSMRYFDREMHAGFFDGHAERLTGSRAWSDPTLWYPKGSTYEGGDATPEVVEALAADPHGLSTVP
jgi:prepilin-type N-terminal cleavage/methylation domain-containing protein